MNQFTKKFDKNNNSKIYLCKRVQTKLLYNKMMIDIILQYDLNIILWIASAKSQSVREASHQPAFMGS